MLQSRLCRVQASNNGIRSVGHEATGLDKIAAIEDRWQSLAKRKRVDARAIGGDESLGYDVKCVHHLGLECLEGGSDIFRSPDFEWRDFETECAGR